jgi:hypothetical protein
MRSEEKVSEIWHIITPEYPPRIGGVADYTRQVVEGLRAAGDRVHVWCSGTGPATLNREAEECDGTACVHWVARGMVPAGLESLTRELDRFEGPKRLLVQWVPHGYGWQSMNLPFCFWVWNRARRGDEVEIMLHEPFLQFGEGSLKQDAAAVVHRFMTMVLLRGATRVWMSTPSWGRMWSPYRLGRSIPFQWLPVPTNIPLDTPQGSVQSARQRYAPLGQKIVGHFGTHQNLITQMLDASLPALLRGREDRVGLLIGQASDRYLGQFIERNPDLKDRVMASGSIDAPDVSQHLLACDLLLQPYPEGITARRTTAMAGLAHGVPMVSSVGPMSEDFWKESGALALASSAPEEITRLAEEVLSQPLMARHMSERARAFYDEHFACRHMIRALRRGSADTAREPQTACFASE